MGINRNIVECKVHSCAGNWQRINCINRNIVECKEINYKEGTIEVTCINRNIVECKDNSRHRHTEHRVVLIETLWNVKLAHYSSIFPGILY